MPTLKGGSFTLLVEKKPAFFQQEHRPSKSHFHLIPFLAPADDEPEAEEREKKGEEEEYLETLRQQGEKIIAEARQEAGKIKEDAHRQGLAEGVDAGREEGRKEGRKEVLNRFLPLEDTLKYLIEQVEQVQEAVLTKQEQEILHLCTKMAQAIIHTEIQQNPEVILANLREGLKSVGHHKVAAIKLNPADLKIIQNLREEISQSILNLERVTLEGDPGLWQGGCLIQTDLGYVDASIETQLHELEKTFGEKPGEKQ